MHELFNIYDRGVCAIKHTIDDVTSVRKQKQRGFITPAECDKFSEVEIDRTMNIIINAFLDEFVHPYDDCIIRKTGAKVSRNTDWERRDFLIAEHPECLFTIDQVRDICALIREGKLPDSSYSGPECNLYEAIETTLGVHTW